MFDAQKSTESVLMIISTVSKSRLLADQIIESHALEEVSRNASRLLAHAVTLITVSSIKNIDTISTQQAAKVTLTLSN